MHVSISSNLGIIISVMSVLYFIFSSFESAFLYRFFIRLNSLISKKNEDFVEISYEHPLQLFLVSHILPNAVFRHKYSGLFEKAAPDPIRCNTVNKSVLELEEMRACTAYIEFLCAASHTVTTCSISLGDNPSCRIIIV